MIVRAATLADADGLAALINEIIAIGGTTAHRTAFDADRMATHYIAPARSICCSVAEDAGTLLGFQALEWADPDWQGEDRLPADWAIIASFVRVGETARGIGGRLFQRTLDRARGADVTAIDATIRRENTGGLAYYARMGFVTYRDTPDTVSKKFDLRATRER